MVKGVVRRVRTSVRLGEPELSVLRKIENISSLTQSESVRFCIHFTNATLRLETGDVKNLVTTLKTALKKSK